MVNLGSLYTFSFKVTECIENLLYLMNAVDAGAKGFDLSHVQGFISSWLSFTKYSSSEKFCALQLFQL